MVGTIFYWVFVAFANGIGTLRAQDSQWRISGTDPSAGAQVRMVAVDGATLTVEAA